VTLRAFTFVHVSNGRVALMLVPQTIWRTTIPSVSADDSSQSSYEEGEEESPPSSPMRHGKTSTKPSPKRREKVSPIHSGIKRRKLPGTANLLKKKIERTGKTFTAQKCVYAKNLKSNTQSAPTQQTTNGRNAQFNKPFGHCCSGEWCRIITIGSTR
jgi:hypothetical protein